MKQPFQIGQKVWRAYASAHGHKKVTCPVCSGKRRITMILGDGEHVSVECDFCGKGYEGSQGTVNAWAPHSQVDAGEVTGVEVRDGKWHVSTRAWSERDGNVFDSEAAAEERCAELHAKAEVHAQEMWEDRWKSGRRSKQGGWTIGYHRNQIKEAERSLAWHREKLEVLKAAKKAEAAK